MSKHPKLQIVYRNPVEIKPHDLVKDLPMLGDDSPDFQALCDEVLRDGAMTPIFITETEAEVKGVKVLVTRVVEGRHRNRAYKFAQRDVPCIIISEEEAEHVALKANTLRRHLLKFQLAFAYYPVITRAIARAKDRQLQNLKGAATESPTDGLSKVASTAEDLANQLGISRALLFEAKQTRDALLAFDEANDPQTWPDSPRKKQTALAYFTAKIMDDEDPMILGHVRAGLGGKAKTTGKEITPRSLSKVMVSACVTFTNQMKEIGSLEDLKPEERKELRDQFSAQFLTQRKWTKEDCERAIKGLDELKKEFTRLAKQAGETQPEKN